MFCCNYVFQDSFEVANVEISQRLQAEGLSSQCDEGEKLMYIWRLYKKLEVCINHLLL